MTEIERKFLVTDNVYKKKAKITYTIVQGFLNTHPERTVRVRIKKETGYLTIKGISNRAGTSRFEWETQIDLMDAYQLLNLCEEGLLEKTRYEIPVGKHVFEVDEFHGENQGLVVAEIELNSETERFEIPDWLGAEVTGDIKYYNSHLSKQPFNTWKK